MASVMIIICKPSTQNAANYIFVYGFVKYDCLIRRSIGGQYICYTEYINSFIVIRMIQFLVVAKLFLN